MVALPVLARHADVGCHPLRLVLVQGRLHSVDAERHCVQKLLEVDAPVLLVNLAASALGLSALKAAGDTIGLQGRGVGAQRSRFMVQGTVFRVGVQGWGLGTSSQGCPAAND